MASLPVGGGRVASLLRELADIFFRRSVERHSPSRLQHLATLQARSSTGARDVTLLKDELSRKRRQHDRQRAELQSAIEAGIAEHDALVSDSEAQLLRVRAVMADTSAEAEAGHAAKSGDMHAQLATLRQQYAAAVKEHETQYEAALQRIARAQAEIERVQSEYDTAMAAADKDLTELRRETEHAHAVIGGLESYFSKVDAEKARIREEDRAHHAATEPYARAEAMVRRGAHVGERV
jgi:chromosome segregation ATPase